MRFPRHTPFTRKPRWPLAKGWHWLLMLLVAIAPLGSSPFASAQEIPIPARFATSHQNVDYPGNDLTPLYDVPLERCFATCLNREDCVAFTYNETYGVCFPKRALSSPVPFDGARSAIITRQPAGALELARAAQARLSFLEVADFEAAYHQALTMAERFTANGLSEAELLAQAQQLTGQVAVARTGAAVTVLDSGTAWLAHAQALRNAAALESGRQYELTEAAIAAAINANLRLPEPANAPALVQLALALEANWRGRTALFALRRAEGLQPGSGGADLVRLENRHGFRVLDHDIDTISPQPRICVRFSEPLDPLVDYEPFVVRSVAGLGLETVDRQLCIGGVDFGERYTITLRAGLPSLAGEQLRSDLRISTYVRDRTPLVRFPGRAFVLPAVGPRALPIETINANTLALRLLQISDRNLVAAIRAGQFAQAIAQWEQARFEAELTEVVWEGTAELAGDLNRATQSLLPLDAVGPLDPGIYALRASIPDREDYDSPAAIQWFLVSDLGLSTFSGNDGLHVVVQRLSDAQPVAGVNVSLISRSNRVLAEVLSNDRGHVHFPAAITRGSGAAAPILVLVEGIGDLAVLSLDEPEFDLSDRGVAGRLAAGPIDLYLTSDRGVYRPGETIHVTALARDARTQAIPGLPISLRLLRPDGVEALRLLSDGGQAGGHVFSLPIGGDAPRGLWRLEVYADPTAPALATQTVLVEDFLPERLGVELALSGAGAVDVRHPPQWELAARLLFGPPAADLPVEGTLTIATTADLDGWPGFRFGRFDQSLDPQRIALPAGLRTDAAGQLRSTLPLSDVTLEARPYTLTLRATVSDGASRPVERVLRTPLLPTAPVVGIRPNFEGTLPQASDAEFELVRVQPDGAIAAGDLRWQVDRVQTRYQWFVLGGSWRWEPIVERERVAEGVVTLTEGPARIRVPLTWGSYELRVTHEGAPLASAALPFRAGWFASDSRRDSPDLLPIALDAERYSVGEEAQLRIDAEGEGVAIVSVLHQSLVSMQMVPVRGVTTVGLPVSEAWGAGAYVTVQLLRPSDGPEHLPSRSLGLTYATISPGNRVLPVALELPGEIRSNAALPVRLTLPEGSTGPHYATVAAIDVGILSLTAFPTPDPIGYLFGQQRLGVAIRDLYSRLIDPRQGALGRVRSGGGADDANGGAVGRPVPAEVLVSYFSGLLELPSGGTELLIDLPPFSGSVRVMAVVWSAAAVGQASGDVLVRDPVVVQASLPRFLTPGDRSRLRVELTHVHGATGTMTLEASGHGLGTYPGSLTLAPGGRAVIDIPLEPHTLGDHSYRLTVLTPDGERITRDLQLSVLHSDPVIARSSRFTLQPGASFRFGTDALAGNLPGTASATLVAGAGAALDTPALLLRLLDYPYGCSEQIASALQPLLVARSTVVALGLLDADEIDLRLRVGMERILSRQARSGAFGLWSAAGAGSSLWLDAYLTETLLRLEAAGIKVPPAALRSALDNLRNALNRNDNFSDDATGGAYALWVLAQAGEAAVGDLRYYADTLADRFNTPLAAGHLAAALASYSERARSEALFARALQLTLAPEWEGGWRSDFGTPLRDRAALLSLASAARSDVIDLRALANAIAQRAAPHTLSTQEASWSLRAAISLGAAAQGLTLDGAPVRGDLLHLYRDTPVRIGNSGEVGVPVTLTVFGIPVGGVQASGNGYRIQRHYFTPDGLPADLTQVAVGDRLVTVLEVHRDRGVPGGRLLLDDALPAGFEIDNPNLLQSGVVRGLDALGLQTGAAMTEARSERFLAAIDWTAEGTLRVGYIVRAVSAGDFHHPAALVEDMYRPTLRAVTTSGRITIRP
jgi:alpha-2-macroglobulin